MELHRAEDLAIEDYLRLGRAIGAVFGQNSQVLAARDGIHVSRLAKRAIVVGAAASGASVLDLRLAPDLLVEFGVAKGRGDAGVHVGYGGQGILVQFFAREHEEERARRILQFLRAGEFPHTPLAAMGEVTLYPNAVEDFVRDMHKRVDFLKGHRVLVDCGNTALAVVAPFLFESYGMKVALFNDTLSNYKPPQGRDAFLRRLREGDFQFGIRLLGRGAELERPGGAPEDFPTLVELLRHLGKA